MIFFLLVAVFNASEVQSEAIVLGPENTIIPLGSQVSYQITDEHAQLSDLKNDQTGWQKMALPDFLTPEQSLWGKVSLRYDRIESARYTFIIHNHNLDYVDVYVLDDLGRILHSANIGANRPFSNRPFNYREFAIPFELSFGQSFDILFRIKDHGPLAFDTSLWKSTALIKKESRNLALIGIFTGALLALGAYFMVTYIMLHSPVRFWFAVSNLVFLLLFLNNEGIFGQMTGQTEYIVPVSLILVALAVHCAAKVSYAMLEGLPGYWRLVNYICCAAFIVIALLPDAYWQIVLAAGLGAAVILLQLFLAIVYRNPFNSLPNRVYILGWLGISLTALAHTVIFINGQLLDTTGNLGFNLLILVGVLGVAVAVEAHEKVLLHKQYEKQNMTIADLHFFYDFFRNSAEGLYCSTSDGQLISINPAMCQLFGYQNEQQLLNQVPNTRQFYANDDDRDALIGEFS